MNENIESKVKLFENCKNFKSLWTLTTFVVEFLKLFNVYLMFT